jgi:hypothetical protein
MCGTSVEVSDPFLTPFGLDSTVVVTNKAVCTYVSLSYHFCDDLYCCVLFSCPMPRLHDGHHLGTFRSMDMSGYTQFESVQVSSLGSLHVRYSTCVGVIDSVCYSR